jgi:hypothetical protein
MPNFKVMMERLKLFSNFIKNKGIKKDGFNFVCSYYETLLAARVECNDNVAT